MFSINSAAENTAVFNQITDPSLWTVGGLTGPWIGLYQPPGSVEPAGGWKWVDGTTIASFAKWFSTQPDNFFGDDVGIFWAGGSAIGDTWGDNVDSLAISPSISFVAEARDAATAPGPLPIFGAAAAYGYSRKLRKRIKSSAFN